MAAALDTTRVVDFFEAAYALDRSDEEWLVQSLRAFAALCGSRHSYMGFFYDASNVADLKVWNRCRLESTPPELLGIWRVFEAAAGPDFVRSTFRTRLFGSARGSALECIRPLLAERERNGYGDFFCLNALDPSGLGCTLTFGCREYEFLPEVEEVALLKRAAAHLSAAYRCRRRLASAGSASSEERLTSGAEAILDGNGCFVHAEGEALSRAARERIRSAAAQIESARTTERRRAANAAARWHPLIGARWTLVDGFVENGRRYVVARENHAGLPGFTLLTDRERQVVIHAALGLTNKEIAYTLGVSDVTVRVLLARAARRLGVRGRKELLAHPDLQELRRTGSTDRS